MNRAMKRYCLLEILTRNDLQSYNHVVTPNGLQITADLIEYFWYNCIMYTTSICCTSKKWKTFSQAINFLLKKCFLCVWPWYLHHIHIYDHIYGCYHVAHHRLWAMMKFNFRQKRPTWIIFSTLNTKKLNVHLSCCFNCGLINWCNLCHQIC